MLGFYILWIGFLLYTLLDTDPEHAFDDEIAAMNDSDDLEDGNHNDDDGDDGGDGKKKKKKRKSSRKSKKNKKKRMMRNVAKAAGLMAVILVVYFISVNYQIKTMPQKEAMLETAIEDVQASANAHAAQQTGKPTAVPAHGVKVANMAEARGRLRAAVRRAGAK
mmetsp:Transcript_1480/g.4089  ORF Transcript_1480/g.4089 Transcript_1480/m.4089 type:complete len:164 (-) Transcript_1480:119-610(-)|eukprot:CAMPEP_0198132576 /NCGR_PEP_ID=MMETSP1442-20131203/58624_1 /TAXON_ID= /ORGANISM="Craspedostauros australis, Strain CCMP3328" /LENGTH=163 /DNA_ID=CAMNT_0043793615 /DNA_START=117 /DNA_END=608 /DNA_ORIENTATION=+